MQTPISRQTPQTRPLDNRALARLEARALAGLEGLAGRERPARRHYLRSVRSAPSRKALATPTSVVEVEPEPNERGSTTDDAGEDEDPDLDGATVRPLCLAYRVGAPSAACTREARGQSEDCSPACKRSRNRHLKAIREVEQQHGDLIDRNLANKVWLEARARFMAIDDLIRSNRGLTEEAFDRPAEDVHGAVLQRRRITDAPVARSYGLEEKLQRGHIDGSLLDLRLAQRLDYVAECHATQRRLRRELYERAAQHEVVRLQDRGDRHQIARDFEAVAA